MVQSLDVKYCIYLFELQVKNLLTIHPSDEVPVKKVTIRKIPR